VEKTERMLDVLAAIQLHNRLLQKTLTRHREFGTAANTNEDVAVVPTSEMSSCFQLLTDCFCNILCDG
jgi:hypothetical protein